VIADDVTGAVVADCGHFVPEERPDELAALLLRHFANR
jgi:pimeloyl-ACP methyl ester carboxylesterase